MYNGEDNKSWRESVKASRESYMGAAPARKIARKANDTGDLLQMLQQYEAPRNPAMRKALKVAGSGTAGLLGLAALLSVAGQKGNVLSRTLGGRIGGLLDPFADQ